MSIQIETDRLTLRPMCREEALSLAEQERDAVLRGAFFEMLAAIDALPGREYWGAPWKISLHGGVHVGDACFKGAPDENGCVELGYGISDEYRNLGYATEAVSVLSDWALRQEGCRCVTAETEPENRISQRVLAKCGFLPCGMGEEGPLFAYRS